MKFIKNGIVYETNNEFVIGQMQKYGYKQYEETKVEKPIEKEVEIEEKPKRKKK